MQRHSWWTGLRARLMRQPSDDMDVAEHQVGAIPYTVVEGQTVFLIVTSRRSGRWIFPKGAPRKGTTPQETAAREAYEEAGVTGTVEDASVGSYRTFKRRAMRRVPIEVAMYPLRVESQAEDWPENGQRLRHWVVLPEAKRLLAQRRLAELAELVSRRARQPA